jgi:hypothetical protein
MIVPEIKGIKNCYADWIAGAKIMIPQNFYGDEGSASR